MRWEIADARIPRLVSHNLILSGATGFNGPSSEINALQVSRLNLPIAIWRRVSVAAAREEEARGFTLVHGAINSHFCRRRDTDGNRRLGTKPRNKSER